MRDGVSFILRSAFRTPKSAIAYDSPMRRLFVKAIGTILVLTAIVALGGYLYLRRSLPQTR